ncbi:MAG: YifB family Mg chelatase-like AAA ATPase [Thermodesulfobacteriota bacterium]
MLSQVNSGALLGIEGYKVEVQVDLARGLPSFATVGLPEGAVRESKDRVKSALKNCGYSYPREKVTVNLAPADVKKTGAGFDLPMAVGLLAAQGILTLDRLGDYLLIGELSLDGRLQPIKGALSLAMTAREAGLKGLVLPRDNAPEAAVVKEIEVRPADHLPAVVEFLAGEADLPVFHLDLAAVFDEAEPDHLDLHDVRGQEQAKRALEVAAAGAHNVLMLGPPGSGKTMLAQRLPSILPPLTFEEALETTRVFSAVGLVPAERALVTVRPFRSPHHTISDAGLIGGGANPRPGEVSLAHNGVLFLDELPEFKKSVLEVMRQPLEDGWVTIARAAMSLSFPARFMLVAAMNPCPCGYFGDLIKECTCTPSQVQKYRSHVSGPLLDRIDLHLEVPAVKYKDLGTETSGESSRIIRERVKAARRRQAERLAPFGLYSNAQMQAAHLRRFCQLDDQSRRLLETAMQRLGLSARAYTRVLKLARTIADLEGDDEIAVHHVSEAIGYRSLDRARG